MDMRETNIINNLEKPFVAYRSSAGSGKTFTLVKEYLRLLLFAYNENAEVSKNLAWQDKYKGSHYQHGF